MLLYFIVASILAFVAPCAADVCTNRGYINLFPSRTYCQSDNHAIGIDEVYVKGIYTATQKEYQVHMRNQATQPVFAYLVDNQLNQQYVSMQFNSINLTTIEIFNVLNIDTLELAADRYNSDAGPTYFDCTTVGFSSHAFVSSKQTDAGLPTCECQAYHVLFDGDCLQGCVVETDQTTGVTQGAYGRYCQHRMPSTLSDSTQYITYDGYVRCRGDGDLFYTGLCQSPYLELEEKPEKKHGCTTTGCQVFMWVVTSIIIAWLFLFVFAIRRKKTGLIVAVVPPTTQASCTKPQSTIRHAAID